MDIIDKLQLKWAACIIIAITVVIVFSLQMISSEQESLTDILIIGIGVAIILSTSFGILIGILALIDIKLHPEKHIIDERTFSLITHTYEGENNTAKKIPFSTYDLSEQIKGKITSEDARIAYVAGFYAGYLFADDINIQEDWPRMFFKMPIPIKAPFKKEAYQFYGWLDGEQLRQKYFGFSDLPTVTEITPEDITPKAP